MINTIRYGCGADCDNCTGCMKILQDETIVRKNDNMRSKDGGERMTDTEQKRIKAICKVAHVNDISDLSDGYHTFKQLYYQRMVLFATLVKQNRDKAWKSLRHEDGELCFGGGWFIVGIDTPEGSYTYHYENSFYSLFDCVELERAKHWDGHTEKDVIRLLSLEQEQKTGYWRSIYQGDEIINYRCSECEFGHTFGKRPYEMHYCPNCGAKMKGLKE